MPMPFQPAVFACPSRNGIKPERVWPPPYPAWPEIRSLSTFYTLPALGLYNDIGAALYWPPQCYWNSKDVLYREHAFESITAIKDICNSICPIAFSSPVSHGIGMLRAKAVDSDWDAFAYFHDLGHYISLKIGRATTQRGGHIVSSVLDLLRPPNVVRCGNFWAEFEIRNGALVDFLNKAMAFEEIRANLFAFKWLNPRIKEKVEKRVRSFMVMHGQLRLFNDVIKTAGLSCAWEYSLASELSEPENPMLGWQRLSETPHENWKISNIIYPRSGWDIELVGSLSGTIKMNIFHPWIVFREEYRWDLPFQQANSKRIPWAYREDIEDKLSYSQVWEIVFLESLRQQLAQFFGVSLVCPFQQNGNTCCGFGHYLRAIWEKTLPEHRSAKAILHPKTGKEIVVRPPRKTCLNYCLG